jgi:hypothetical protein
MEDWWARVDEKGSPTCLMGHTQKYQRRKADVDCFIKDEFVDPEPTTDPCDCTDDDFECDFNFVRSTDRKNCELAPGAARIVPDGECKDPKGKFKGSSGWRKIPGNDCKPVSGAQKDDLKEYDCEGSVADPASGNINNHQEVFDGKYFQNKVYLERTSLSTGLKTGAEDETVLMRTDEGVFLSHDHGKKWTEILPDEKIVQIYPHTYFNDMVFFITETERVFYSTDRGDNIRHFDAPYPPARGLSVLNFHPKNKDWFIWTGAKDCDSEEGCHTVASVTTDRGDGPWVTLQRYVRKCEFIREPERKLSDDERKKREKLIYC